MIKLKEIMEEDLGSVIRVALDNGYRPIITNYDGTLIDVKYDVAFVGRKELEK